MTKFEKDLYVTTTLALLWALSQTRPANAAELGPPKTVIPTDLIVPQKAVEQPPQIHSGAASDVLIMPPLVPALEPLDESDFGLETNLSAPVKSLSVSPLITPINDIPPSQSSTSEVVLQGLSSEQVESASVTTKAIEPLPTEAATISETALKSLQSNSGRNRTPQVENGYLVGIDVSDYQENVNWKKVSDSGVSFAYLKVSEGKRYRTDTFKPYRQAARENGILTGGYHFFRPEVSAKEQAEYFLATIGKLEADDLPPALDLEDASLWVGYSTKEKLSMVLTWLETVEAKTGVRPVIYSGPVFMEDVLGSAPELTKYHLWLSHYTSRTSPSLPKSFSKWQIWQHTDRGSLPGVDGDVDMNRFAGDRSQLLALGRSDSDTLPPLKFDRNQNFDKSQSAALAEVTPGIDQNDGISSPEHVIPKQPKTDDGILNFDVT